MEDLSAFAARPRLAALLDHFAEIADARQGWKVMYPLREVLFLVVCGTIASGDDYGLGQRAPRLPARLCRIPFRHSLRRLAALHHEPHRPQAV